MAAGHIEMRKRAEANNNKVGTKNPQKVKDELDRKEGPAIPAWAMYTLFFVVCGGSKLSFFTFLKLLAFG